MTKTTLNKLKLAVGFCLLACISSVIATNHESYMRRMGEQQWIEIILTTHYNLRRDYAYQLADVIRTASETQEVPIDVLISVMAIESRFDYEAHSPCHAIGLMQVRPDVWGGVNPFNIHDRYENVLAGAWILRQYYDELGSWQKAVAAYNIGITHYRQGRAKPAAARYLSKYNKERKTITTKYPKVVSTL